MYFPPNLHVAQQSLLDYSNINITLSYRNFPVNLHFYIFPILQRKYASGDDLILLPGVDNWPSPGISWRHPGAILGRLNYTAPHSSFLLVHNLMIVLQMHLTISCVSHKLHELDSMFPTSGSSLGCCSYMDNR